MKNRFNNSRFAKIILGITMLFALVPASASAVSLNNAAISLPTHTFAGPSTSAATKSLADQCTKGFLGLEPWYKFMDKELNDGTAAQNPGLTDAQAKSRKCDVRCFNLTPRDASDPNDCGQSASDVPLVLAAVIDDLLRIAGLVAVGFAIYGAIQYVISQGDPQATSRAQGTIINALIGMAVAMIAVLVVSFIGNTLRK